MIFAEHPLLNFLFQYELLFFVILYLADELLGYLLIWHEVLAEPKYGLFSIIHFPLRHLP